MTKELIAKLREFDSDYDMHYLDEAADALEEADRKERNCEAQHGDLVRCNAELHRHLAEVEHNLEIAVAALRVVVAMPRAYETHRRAIQALAQIWGEE